MTMRTIVALSLAVGFCGIANFAGAADAPEAKPPATEVKPAPKPPAPKPKSYITIEEAGPDYAIQGEYGGALAGKLEPGAQVLALGDGKFRAVVYAAGLPGAGWSGDKATRVTLEGKRQGDGPAVFAGVGWAGSTVDGKTLTLTDPDGKKFELGKLERKSPTLGAKPPEGAVVLFDGTASDKWQGGKVDARGFLGVQGGEPKTKEKFGDATFHVEFMTPFMPTAGGQGRGNSGVYLQNRYELQVLDSFGLEGVDNECGGIYKNAAPKVNMCLPPLVWQTYDIDFTAAKWDGDKKTANAIITVRHNGVVIQDALEIKGATGGGDKELPTAGPLKFQDHGNPVFYRNIWVVEKK